MTSEWKDRVIGGLIATVLVLSYVGIAKPLARPSYGDAPTCWVERDSGRGGSQTTAYCGDADLVKWDRFVKWVEPWKIKNYAKR